MTSADSLNPCDLRRNVCQAQHSTLANGTRAVRCGPEAGAHDMNPRDWRRNPCETWVPLRLAGPEPYHVAGIEGCETYGLSSCNLR